MRIDRMLPVGLLVTAGIGVGCGEVTTGTTETSSALAARKVNPFEARVRERKELSDPGLMPPARRTDTTLVNAWGLALDPKTGFAWISSNGAGTAEVVDEDGRFKKSVMLPDGSAPTGDVFNPTHSFKGDDFIFATENGTIIGVKRDAADFRCPALPRPRRLELQGPDHRQGPRERPAAHRRLRRRASRRKQELRRDRRARRRLQADQRRQVHRPRAAGRLLAVQRDGGRGSGVRDLRTALGRRLPR